MCFFSTSENPATILALSHLGSLCPIDPCSDEEQHPLLLTFEARYPCDRLKFPICEREIKKVLVYLKSKILQHKQW